jgi:hypothetical protein
MVNGSSAGIAPIDRLVISDDAGLDLWADSAVFGSRVITTNDGTKYWTLELHKYGAGDTTIATRSTGTVPDTAGTHYSKKVSIAAVVDVSTDVSFYWATTKTSTPGTLDATLALHYRFIGV